MPSRASKHFFHKNRSQASLLSSQDPNGARPSFHPSPIDSPLHSPAFPPPTAAALHDEIEGPQHGHPYPADDPRPSRTALPTRSQSQRTPPAHPSPFNHPQPTIQLVAPSAGQQASPVQSVIDEDPDAYYHQEPHKEEPKKRRFFGLGSSSRDSNTSAPASSAAPQRLGRSISVRTKNYPYQNPPVSNSRPVQQRWPSDYPPPASEEDDDIGADLPSSASGPAPPIPDKDPLSLYTNPSAVIRTCINFLLHTSHLLPRPLLLQVIHFPLEDSKKCSITTIKICKPADLHPSNPTDHLPLLNRILHVLTPSRADWRTQQHLHLPQTQAQWARRKTNHPEIEGLKI
ncbi:MAG: hypothetical protein L6R36_008878 [Xanthoria steineri]|nr:MAG: hypothetical protein L6R36_008878 [Xanthoria steineri]